MPCLLTSVPLRVGVKASYNAVATATMLRHPELPRDGVEPKTLRMTAIEIPH